MKHVLDTNVVIAALNGAAPVRASLNALGPSDGVLLGAIVLAELRYGALCSARREDNLARLEELAGLFEFAEITREVARCFAEIKADLRSRGIAKSDADLLIAATALAAGATLVTADKALLDGEIPGLVAIDWSNAAERR